MKKTKYVVTVTMETPQPPLTRAAIKRAVEFMLRDMDIQTRPDGDWVGARKVRVRNVDID